MGAVTSPGPSEGAPLPNHVMHSDGNSAALSRKDGALSISQPSVFVIGSSTTLLMHPYLEQMLRGVCAYSRKGSEDSGIRQAMEDLDVPVGASAGDSEMVLDYLRALDQVGTFRPDVVLLHVGMHDIKTDPSTGRKQLSLARFRENVENIVNWFGAKGIQLIWIRPGPLDEALHNSRNSAFLRFEADLHAYNEAADSILQRHGLPVLDLARFTRRLGPMDQLLKDHVHFVEDVVRQQAAFIAGYMTHYLYPCRVTMESGNGEP